MNTIIDNSVALLLFKFIIIRCGIMERNFVDTFHCSYTCRYANGFLKIIKKCLKYSFLGKLSEIKDIPDVAICNESKVIAWFFGLWRRKKERALLYLATSKSADLCLQTKNQFYALPLKTLSGIVLAAVLVNIFLTFFLCRNISLAGWLLRALFFLTSIGGLYCDVDWQGLEKSSFILNKWLKK